MSNPNGAHWVTYKKGIKVEGELAGKRRGAAGVGGGLKRVVG